MQGPYISSNLSCLLQSHLTPLTHWGRVTHICVGNLTIIGSDNGLSPGRRQAVTWTNVGILLIGPIGTNFSEMLIEINAFSFKKIHLKMSSGKWQPFCLGLNVLRTHFVLIHTCTEYWYTCSKCVNDSFKTFILDCSCNRVTCVITKIISLNSLELGWNYRITDPDTVSITHTHQWRGKTADVSL